MSSASGRVGGAGGCPTVGAGIVSAAGVQIAVAVISAPDDHFAAGPHCRVSIVGQRARWWCWWLSNCRCWDCISRRCSKLRAIKSTPDDHFAAGPHCRVIDSGSGRVGGAGGCPTIGARIVSAAGVQRAAAIISAPDDHFAASPHCRVIISAIGRAGGAGRCPRVVRAGNRRTVATIREVCSWRSLPPWSPALALRL